ncbi:MAG TPA: relaxase domain-containing protein [Terracidiphilus sp.]
MPPLSQGQHPQTGEQLVRHRAGWDRTFPAQKSVSLAALVGDDDRIREAHRASAGVALEQLKSCTMARMGGHHRAEPTAKFIAAKFEHDTARAVDGYAAP